MSSTCNRLDLQTLGSRPIMHKKLRDHCVRQLNLDKLDMDCNLELYIMSLQGFHAHLTRSSRSSQGIGWQLKPWAVRYRLPWKPTNNILNAQS